MNTDDLEILAEVAEEKTIEKMDSDIFSSNYDSVIYNIAISENTMMLYLLLLQ